MRAPEADSAGQADHSTLVRMNGPHGQEFHFFTCFAPLLVHLNIIPRPSKNLRQAASTDSRVLVAIGLSGISSLCVFWRIRIASVELIDSRHREGPDCFSFYNGYLVQTFNRLARREIQEIRDALEAFKAAVEAGEVTGFRDEGT